MIRSLWAALVLGTLLPLQAAAQRPVPPLYPTAPTRPVTPGRPDTTGLEVRLSPGVTGGAARSPVARGERLGDAAAARLLARARPLRPDSAARDSFAFPAQTLPAPRAGATVLAGLGARDSAGGPPPRPAPAALTVTRRAPEGEVPMGVEVTVTFSQPMVPLGSVGSLEGQAVPARLSPGVPGAWRWLDVRTLRFEPRGRLPMATEFTVEVPAGTASATGERLAQGVRWSFATPAPRATGAWPNGGAPVAVRPVVVVAFDQRVSPAAVLPFVRMQAGGARVPLRLATAAEVQGDADARVRVAGLEAGRWIAFVPERPLASATAVEVVLEPGTPSAEGPRRTTEAQRWSFRTFGALRLVRGRCGYGGECRPGMPFVLEFSNPIPDTLDVARLVRVEPALDGMRVSVGHTQVVVMGRTRPFTRYTVRVDGALRDVFGQRLGAPAEASFQVGAPVPALWAGAQGMVVLDPQGSRTVSVFARDHRRVRVRVHRVGVDDWPVFQRMGRGRGAELSLPGREVVNEVRETGGAVGETRELAVSVERALEGGLGHAVVAVEAVDGATQGERAQAVVLWVQSTRIGVVAFSDAERLTAWATSLVDGRPLEGVELRLAPTGAAGTTDARGLGTLLLPRAEGVYLVARRGGDAALLAPGMGMSGWAQWSRRDEPVRTTWVAFTDRNLYRPGDTVRFKGWVRRMERGGPALPAAGGPVRWRVRDARGNELAKGTAALTALGGFDASFAVPAGANLGEAAVELDGDEGSDGFLGFLVQEFRRPEYEVAVTADPGPHFVGGGADVVARASYFSGGGLPGAPVEWVVQTSPGFFRPPGWDRWSFGPTRPWWWWMDDGERGDETRQLAGVTDATGAHALRLDIGRARPPRPYNVRATATVTDVNRQTWSSTATLLVHPASVYLGVRTDRAWLEEGDTLRLELVATDLDGRLVAGRPIEVAAVRREWRQERGRWSEVEVARDRCTRASAAEPVRCDFAVRGGDYRVEAITTDAQGRPTLTTLRLWVAGPGVRFPGREGNDARRVEMIPDRERYSVGDTARILLRLPFQPVRGVATTRRGGIVRTETFEAAGATHTLRVPITEADVPGVWVAVDVAGATEGGPEDRPTARGVDGASGEVKLDVSRATRTLTVRAIPADSVMLPDAEGAVTVEVRGPDGRPVAGAEVALVGVDESVLALTGYRIADPLPLFYPDPDAGTGDVRLRPLVRVEARELAPAPGTLVGRVVEMRSGEPVGGARVAVAGTALEARTDAQGRFRIRGVPRGALAVVVEMEGFAPTRQEVRVGDDATPPLRLYIVRPGEDGQMGVLQGRAAGVQIEAMSVQDLSGAGRMAPPAAPPPPPMMAPVPEVAAQARVQLRGASTAPQPQIAVRSNFDPLAVWVAAARTDAQGRVRVPFRVPSNLTRYRLTAVAVEGATRFGLGESAISARQPLMVRPSAPRFLNFGDRFELPVVLQNTTGSAMEVEVAARAVGVRFTTPGERVTIPAGDRVEVRLAAEAVQAGTARFQVVAAGGGAQDAAEFSLPVLTPATAEAFATYGTLASGAATLPLEVPMEAIPQFGGLEVSTSSTALSELTDAFLYLVGYRFEGTEQVASRMLSVAALRDVLGAMNAAGLPPADSIGAAVAEDVRRLAARQNADGGFAWWERGRPTAPYPSIHAAHALQRVREAGYDVPAEVWTRALGYLRRVPANLPSQYGADVRRALHAYALYTRRRMGDEVEAEARRLVAEAGDALPLEAAGWLLAASAAPDVRAPLLRLVNNRATETAQTATFATRYTEGAEVLLHSNRRTDAVVLEGLLAADPGSELAAKTVRGLLGHRVRGRWSNPQENAWVLLAVQRYFRAYEAQTPDFVARVWLGDRLASSAPFRGRSADRALTSVPMRVLQAERPGSVTVAKEGTGRLYFRAGLRYAPRDLDLAPLERGFVVSRSYAAVDSASDVVRGPDGIWRVRAGARVRVTVTMTAPSRRLHVALIDPLPAGWEPVNASLLGTEPDPRGERPRPFPGWRAAGWWEHQNLRDDRAEAFATFLPAGTYTYEYVARATTPGLFIVPPPRAEEMYEPETFGRGGTERVIVQ
jgi:hypothetical protein